VRVTPAAKPAWRKIVKVGRKVRARAMAGLSKTQQATLRRLLEAVEVNVAGESTSSKRKTA